MATPNIPLNIPQRHSKGLIVHFGCITIPFYKCDDVAPEGAPVKRVDGETVGTVTAGDGSTIVGLLAQQVYDPSLLGELSGYEFLNNTKAKTGDTIGVVSGQGYVLTNNYAGAVADGDLLYPAASGKLSKTQVSSDASVGQAENAGTDGDTMIRVKINFNIV